MTSLKNITPADRQSATFPELQTITRRASFGRMAGISFGAWAQSGSRSAAESASDPHLFRLACSLAVIGDVNVNDARAAIRSWAGEVGRLARMDLPVETNVLYSPDRLMEMVRNGVVDGVAATTPEFVKMMAYVDPGRLLIDDVYNKSGEEYVILVHGESGIRSIADLRGRELLLFSNPVTCLAHYWLENLLGTITSCGPDSFFKQITLAPRLSRAVLPVYFRQSDACLATRRGVGTMSEMNPDIARQLRVVTISPGVVPICMGFHKNCPIDQKNRFSAALAELPKEPAGKQLLALFQSHGTAMASHSVLASAADMVRDAERIRLRGGRQGCRSGIS